MRATHRALPTCAGIANAVEEAMLRTQNFHVETVMNWKNMATKTIASLQ